MEQELILTIGILYISYTKCYFYIVNSLARLILLCVKNISTKSMRKEGGYEAIQKAIEKLGLRHEEHIASYGEGNEHRLTGLHETADINTFSWVREIKNLCLLTF